MAFELAGLFRSLRGKTGLLNGYPLTMPPRRIPNIPVADPAVPVEHFSIFNRGLKTTDPSADLEPGFSPDLQNMEPTGDGGITTSRGFTELGTDAESTKVLGQIVYKNGATRHLLKVCVSKHVQKWDGSSWSTIATLSSTPSSASGAMAGGNAYIVDGVNTPQKYTGGGSLTAVAAIPVLSFIAYLPSVDRLVGIVPGGATLRFSDVGSYESWPNDAAHTLTVASDDNTDVAGIIPAFGPLMIGKGQGGRGKFTWDGLTFATTGLQPRYGEHFENPKAVTMTPYGVAFWNRNGVWLNTSGFQDSPISQAIDKTLRTMTSGQASKVRLHYQQDRLYLAIPLGGATENNTLFVYDFTRNSDGTTKGWSRRDWAVSELCTFEDASGNLNLILGSTTNGKAYRHYRIDETTNVWNAAGGSMTAYWVSPVYRGARKAILKNISRLFSAWAPLLGQNAELAYREDENSSWSTLTVSLDQAVQNWPEQPWGSGWSWPVQSKVNAIFDNFFFSGHSIQFRVRKIGTNTPITFYGIAYEEEELENYS